MGQARPSVEAWRKQFRQDGWKEDASALEDAAGAMSCSKGNQSLTVTYTDTGLSPAEVTLVSSGVELERAAGRE